MNDAASMRAAVEDLLHKPATVGALEQWAAYHAPDEDAFATAVAAVMPLLTVDPPLALRAAQRLHRLLPSDAPPLRSIAVRRLRAHALRACGEVGEAAAAYADVVTLARAVGADLEAARSGIGWVQSLAILGRVEEAALQARWIRPILRRQDRAAAARLDANLGNAWLHTGETARAQTLFRRAFAWLDANGRPVEAAHAAFGLARSFRRRAQLTASRQWLERARERIAADEHPVLDAYLEVTAASLDLVAGAHESALAHLHTGRERLAALGDRRATLEVDLHAATMLETLGSAAASRTAAQTAMDDARELGSDLDLARAALVAARAESVAGVHADIAYLIEVAARHLPADLGVVAARIELERARLSMLAGDLDAARVRLRKVQPRLDRTDRGGHGAIARMLRAEIDLGEGSAHRAIQLLVRARRDARRGGAALARPRMALGLARAYDRREEGRAALRWARTCVDELERVLLPWHASVWRRAGAQARDVHYAEAVEIVLRHGGRRAAEHAADLAARARSPRLIEDLLHRVPMDQREALRQRWEALRTSLLDADERADPTTRFQSTLIAPPGTPVLDPEVMPAPTLVRRAWRLRRLDSWRRRLAGAQLALFHRGPGGWRAFVVGAQGPVRVVDLPEVEAALQRTWKPLRLLLETAARLPRDRRTLFLERTRDEAEAALQELRRVLWSPLGLDGQRVHLVPDEALHDLPLEALAHAANDGSCASRLPHPALVAGVKRTRGRTALLLHGPGEGQRAEVQALRRRFGRAGLPVRVARRRDALEALDQPAALVHLAAHGVFRRGEGRLSGLLLDDGWVGLEHLPARGLRGSLLVFSSCESGLSSRSPGRDMEGWLSAGFALGAREMVLNLWKVDDAGAGAFSRAFYDRWLDGASAAEAAAAAARESRAVGAHAYHWAAPFCAS